MRTRYRSLTGTGFISAISASWPRLWPVRQRRLYGLEAYPQLAMKTAALMESVARFHSLIDGNKRSAWTLMVLMLWINGCRHDFSSDEAFDLVVGVAAGDVSLEDSAGMIGSHLVKR